MFKEDVSTKGVIHLLARHADGTIFYDRTITNTVVAAGKAVMAALVYGSGTAFTAMALGIGTPSTTALGSESTTNGGTRRSGANVTLTIPNTSTSQWVSTFTFTGSLAITEEGLFNSASSSAGTMLASQSFSVINVINTDTLMITHQLSFS